MATYYVNNVSGNDSNAGTSEAAAWSTLAKAAATATADGDVVFVKNTGTPHNLTATVNWNSAGVLVYGYTNTPGAEDGRPLITTATNSVHLFNVGANRIRFRHLSMSHKATTRGFAIYPHVANRDNCAVTDCLFDGFSIAVNGEYTSFHAFMLMIVDSCYFANCTNCGIACASLVVTNSEFVNCASGIRRGSHNGSSQCMTINACSVRGGSGSGIAYDANYSGVIAVNQTTVKGCGSHGITITNATANTVNLAVQNSIFSDNGGFGLHSANACNSSSAKTAFYNNTSGNRSTTVASAVGEITLTASPFVSGTDLRLNTASGGGAACRGVGTSPNNNGAFSGSLDLGAYQSTPTAAGGGISRGRAVNSGGF